MKKIYLRSLGFTFFVFILFTFKNATSQTNSCGFFCVNNIYFDSTNTMIVSVQHNGPAIINYPYVSAIYDLSGAPIASGGLFYFGQLPNTTLDYTVTSSITPPLPQNFAGIVVFNYDTNTCQILYPNSCGTNALTEQMVEIKKIKLFPNPVENILNVSYAELENLDVRIFNVSGVVVKEIQMEESKNIINCYNLNPGIYFIEFYKKGLIIQREKFIKN